MNDEQQLRYSRHLLLDEWSEQAQYRLLASHAIVIGAGGLGAPALMYLAAAGVGRLTVVDPDTVELSNLQRQVAHTTDGIGLPKVDSAAQTLHRLNPEVTVHAVAQAVDADWLRAHLGDADVVLDCTDRFATRQLINRHAWAAGVPLVSASALRWDGQISTFDPREPTSPCYACLFPPEPEPEETLCALMGVFAPLVGMMGVMQAGEAIRLLAGITGPHADPATHGAHRSLVGQLQMVDGRDGSWSRLRVRKQTGCPVCGTSHAPDPR